MRMRRLTGVLSLAVGLVLLGTATPAWGYGDYDGNGVVDLDDYAHFPACLTGPGGGPGAGCEVFFFDADTDVDFYDFAGFQQVFGASAGVVIDTVLVGNPGNADDTHDDGYGGVDHTYNIGKYEVTAGQYTEFLNAVAGTDTYGLYKEVMGWGEYGCKIERSGSSGSYTYNVAGDWADRPVNYVSWGDAARFANWLHNGQPTGAQDLTTTEDGSYYLNGAMSDAELNGVVREEDATWVIPSEDEWYKAAHHKNDGVTGNYFEYATSSDSVPSNDLVEPTDPGNNATYYIGPTNDLTIGSPYYRTEGGAHENSASPYGTFDQGGNVWEWNESIHYVEYRGVRGGGYSSVGDSLRAENRYSPAYPSFDFSHIGFRVAEVP